VLEKPFLMATNQKREGVIVALKGRSARAVIASMSGLMFALPPLLLEDQHVKGVCNSALRRPGDVFVDI
jgi:hypothetical protein